MNNNYFYFNSYKDLKIINNIKNRIINQGNTLNYLKKPQNLYFNTSRFNRFLKFSSQKKILKIESGVMLSDIHKWASYHGKHLTNLENNQITIGEYLKIKNKKNKIFNFLDEVEIFIPNQGIKKIKKNNRELFNLIKKYFIVSINIKLDFKNNNFKNYLPCTETKINELYIVLGGSSGVGREIVYEAAKKNIPSLIISKSKRDLDALSSDIFIKYGVEITSYVIDFSKKNINFLNVINYIENLTDIKKHVFFTAGYVSINDCITDAKSNFDYIFNVNFYYIVQFISKLEYKKVINDSFSFNFFGSIASIRGRSNNVIYSASKKSLISYYESFKHKYDAKINFFLLGYIDTRMTDGKTLLLKPASPKKLAKKIVNSKTKNFGLLYYPFYWWLISYIIKLIPWRIYKKIGF